MQELVGIIIIGGLAAGAIALVALGWNWFKQSLEDKADRRYNRERMISKALRSFGDIISIKENKLLSPQEAENIIKIFRNDLGELRDRYYHYMSPKETAAVDHCIELMDKHPRNQIQLYDAPDFMEAVNVALREFS